MSWVPLHVHSQYSILDSTAQVSTLASKAAEYGMTSLALTDQGNMYGVVEFYKACLAQKVKPILGCELYVAPFSRHEKKKVFGVSAGYPVVLLVKNSVGYKNLCKLSSLAHLEGFYYTARIDKALMEEFSEGLICLSGSLQGKIASLIVQEKSDELLQEIEWFHRVFKEDFYFEVQRHRMTEEQIQADRMTLEPWLYQKYKEHVDQQEKVIAKFKELSPEYGIPIVATNDSHYILRDEWRAHEILMNVQSGEPCEIWEKDSAGNLKAKVLNPKREVMPSHEFYFKTPQEMEALFSDLPDAIACSSRIADQCSFDLDFKTKYYPVYVPPSLENKEYTVQEREAEVENFLRTLCAEQIPLRYRTEQLDPVRAVYPDQDPMEVIAKRLDYELNLITSKGMSDYLLIVYDFIAWAKRNGIQWAW